MQLDRSRKEAQAQLDKLAGNTVKSRRLMIRRDLSERGAELLATLLQQHEIDARHMLPGTNSRQKTDGSLQDYDSGSQFIMTPCIFLIATYHGQLCGESQFHVVEATWPEALLPVLKDLFES